MTLPASGAISLGNNTGDTTTISVNRELGKASPYQQTVSLNDAAVRTLLGVASGGISLSTAYGKTNRVVQTITISAASTYNYVANTAKITGYVAGKTDATFVINSGAIVGSSTTGTYAFTVDTSWNAADTVKIINNGLIQGRGGDGGNGGNSTLGNGTVGLAGGPALLIQRATTITNNTTIGGGGGGGGGGGNGYLGGQGKSGTDYYLTGGSSGGGGMGFTGGNAGTPGAGAGLSPTNGNSGSAGGYTGAGGGGVQTANGGGGTIGGAGGAGGSLGAAGGAGNSGINGSTGTTNGSGGGAGGACTSGNANITWLVAGTRLGGLG